MRIVPFSTTFEDHPLIERALLARRSPLLAHGIAVAIIALATVLRWLVGGGVVEDLPFITYYPAIIVATFAGGFWPGILAIILSSAAALYFFLPPLFSLDFNHREAASLLLFIFMSGVNLTIVALLDALVERILAQVQNVRVLFESAPTGIVVVDQHGIIKLVNPSTEKQFGYDWQDLVGQRIEVLVPAAQVGHHRGVRQAFLRKPEARAMGAGRDLSGRRKDGSEFPIEIGLNPVGQNGRTAVLATVIDISDRRKAQESQKFIIRELQHRTQNLFAVFQAIANRTVDENKTAAEIKHVLNGRVQALARAYAIVAETAWEGASLAAILDREFAAFKRQVSVAGCDIIIIPSAAQQFALIVHELATNALKYGALSIADGCVSIVGKIDWLNGGTFSFVWEEAGGPPVIAPTRKGFGSVVLFDSAKQFSQSVVVNYAPSGLRYELQLQLGAIEGPKPEGSATRSEVSAGFA
jgi:PAS domain S-box-containing protein